MIRYGGAVGLVALSTLGRLALEPALGARQPFVTYYVAVILAAWLWGVGPAILALTLGALAVLGLILTPGQVSPSIVSDLLGVILYFGVGATVIFLSELNRRIRQKLEAEIAYHQKAEATIREQARLAEYGRDVGLALTENAPLKEMLGRCVAATVRHLDGAFARIWTFNEREDVLELQASAGMYTHIDGPHARVGVGQFKIGRIALERRPHLTNTVIGDDWIPNQEWARKEGLVAFAGYPLIVEDRLVGVLAMFSRRPLSEATLKSMASVANKVALGIMRQWAEAEILRLNNDLERRVEERTAELERVNVELRAFTSRLEWSNRELQEFASVASHDLQEPLRKIQAFGDRLEAKYAAALGEEGRDYLGRMRSAAGRMRTLIDDLLAFSRVTTKAQPFARVDLARIAREVVSDLEGRIAQTEGRVEVGDLPALDADPTQMRQLLQNLIGNGLKFHRPGVPPLLRVRGRTLDADGSAWDDGLLEGPACEIRVEDNGIGFDVKYLDRIFNVFQRLHGRNEYEGTGMGLAICRKIVERHGGSITAHSVPNQGSTFIIRLPLEHARPEEASS